MNAQEDEAYTLRLAARYEKDCDAGKSVYLDVDDFDRLAAHYLGKGDLDRVADVVARAEAVHPGSTEIQLRKAELYLNENHPRKAMSLLEMLPDSSDNRLLRASALMSMEHVDEGLSMLKRVENEADGASDRDLLLLDVADVLINHERYEEALSVLQKAMEANPGNREAYFNYVECCQYLHQPQWAMSCLQRWIDEEPYDNEAWMQLGDIHYVQNEYSKAVEAYEFSLAASEPPVNYLLYVRLGEVESLLSHYAKALDWYLKALPELQEELEKSEVLACIAGCYERQEKYADAIAFYRKSLLSNPDDAQTYEGLGVCYARNQQWEEAENAFEHALQLNPAKAETWIGIGDLYLDRLMLDKALNAYQKAQKCNPDLPEPYYSLGGLYLNRGDYQLALDCYDRLLDWSVENGKVHFFRAVCLTMLDRPKEAEEALCKAEACDPQARQLYHTVFHPDNPHNSDNP